MANEDKATRYHRLQRRASLVATATGATLVLLFVLTGTSAVLRTAVESLTGGSRLTTVPLFVLLTAILYEAAGLPFAYYQGVVLEHRYGLSTETRARWWLNHGKALLLGLAFVIGLALLVSSLIRWSPEWWWAAATAACVALLIGLAQLAPVLLLPLFYDVRPLDRPDLATRLIALADRAGARIVGVFEWHLSARTRKANAALTGIGRTRRILLSDTLLADHSDDEIEVILAHELAHHVYRDIWSGIVLETLLIGTGFYAADALLAAVSGSFGLAGKADVAALPVLALAAGAVSLLFLPLANALSRAHERRADRFALRMTRNVDAFVSAMRRLAARNLAEEEPSRLVEVLLHSHPSTRARIAAARQWQSEQP